jgi:guanylate kinase
VTDAREKDEDTGAWGGGQVIFPIILSSPSGGGKTTIAHRLLAQRTDLGYSVSCTTRAPRRGEQDGVDYHFVTRDEFIERRRLGEFIESAEVHGNLYGTLRREVSRVLAGGRHVIMDIDVQGARLIRESFPAAVSVFLLPPSADVLLDRLKARHTESPAQLLDRLHSALHELRAVNEYDYVVVNDDLDQAVGRVGSIVDAEVVSRERIFGLQRNVEQLVGRLESEIQRHSTATQQ